MIRTYAACVFAISLLLGCQTKEPTNTSLLSPDQTIRVALVLNLPDSSLSYQVAVKKNQEYVTVIEPSSLGLVRDDQDFARGFTAIRASKTVAGSESYEMLVGKKRQQEAAYREKSYTVTKENGAVLTVRFRVFNDGLGFRYEWDDESAESYTIQDERTAFNLPAKGKKLVTTL